MKFERFSLFLATLFALPLVSLAQAPAAGYNMIAPLPGLSTGVTLGGYLTQIFRLTIGLAGVLAVLMLVICGIQMMASGSVSGKSEAKKCIWNALLGVLIAIGAWLLLNTLNPLLVSTSALTPIASTPPGPTPVSGPPPGAGPGAALTFGSPTASVAEDAGSITIPVSRVDGTSAATVHYMTYPLSGVAGTDYTPVTGVITFAPGQLTGTITIPIIDDPYYNGGTPITFGVQIISPTGATIGTNNTVQVTIIDNEPPTAPPEPTPPAPPTPPTPGGPPPPRPVPGGGSCSVGATATLQLPPASCLGRSNVVFREWKPDAKGDGCAFPGQSTNNLGFCLKQNTAHVVAFKTSNQIYAGQILAGGGLGEPGLTFLSTSPCNPSTAVSGTVTFAGVTTRKIAAGGDGTPYHFIVAPDTEFTKMQSDTSSAMPASASTIAQLANNSFRLEPNRYYYMHYIDDAEPSLALTPGNPPTIKSNPPLNGCATQYDPYCGTTRFDAWVNWSYYNDKLQSADGTLTYPGSQSSGVVAGSNHNIPGYTGKAVVPTICTTPTSCTAIPTKPPTTCFGRSVVYAGDWGPSTVGDGSGTAGQAPNRLWYTIYPDKIWIVRVKTNAVGGYWANGVSMTSWDNNIGFISEKPCDFTTAVQDRMAEQGMYGPTFHLPVLADNQVPAFLAANPSIPDQATWKGYLKPNTWYYLHMLDSNLKYPKNTYYTGGATNADLAAAKDHCSPADVAAYGNCYYIIFDNLANIGTKYPGNSIGGLPAPTPNAACTATSPPAPPAPAPTPLPVGPSGSVDLIAKSVFFSSAWGGTVPIVPAVGQSVFMNIKYDVTNGTFTPFAPMWKLYRDGGEEMSFTPTGPALGPGVNFYGGTSGPWVATAGTHSLSATVDPLNSLLESNEGNNTVSQSYTISPLPAVAPVYTPAGSPWTISGVVYSTLAQVQAAFPGKCVTINGVQLIAGTLPCVDGTAGILIPPPLPPPPATPTIAVNPIPPAADQLTWSYSDVPTFATAKAKFTNLKTGTSYTVGPFGTMGCGVSCSPTSGWGAGIVTSGDSWKAEIIDGGVTISNVAYFTISGAIPTPLPPTPSPGPTPPPPVGTPFSCLIYASGASNNCMTAPNFSAIQSTCCPSSSLIACTATAAGVQATCGTGSPPPPPATSKPSFPWTVSGTPFATQADFDSAVAMGAFGGQAVRINGFTVLSGATPGFDGTSP